MSNYRQTSNISRTFVGNKIADNPNAIGATLVGAAPTTSSLSIWHLASMDWAKTTATWNEKDLRLGVGVPYIRSNSDGWKGKQHNKDE